MCLAIISNRDCGFFLFILIKWEKYAALAAKSARLYFLKLSAIKCHRRSRFLQISLRGQVSSENYGADLIRVHFLVVRGATESSILSKAIFTLSVRLLRESQFIRQISSISGKHSAIIDREFLSIRR